MAAGNELLGVDTFLVAKLKADSALVALIGGSTAPRIWTDMAPQTVTLPDGSKAPVFPHVLILFLSGVDRNALPATARVLTRVVYLVKAVTQEDTYSGAKAIAKRIDAALIDASGAVPAEGIYVGPVYREGLRRFIEIDPSGRRVNHLGGQYRSEITAYP